MAKLDIDPESTDLLVHAYLDNELDVATGLVIEQRISADPALAMRAANIRALSEVLRANFSSEPLPSHLETRLLKLGQKTVNRYQPTWGGLAAAILVSIALSSTSTWFAFQAMSTNSVTSELIDGHLRSLAAEQPTDVTSSDRHTVKPWFNGKVAQSPRVKELSASGFPLIGGRIDVLNKVPVPTLVYNRRRHAISVTAAPMSIPGPTEDAANGFNVLRWGSDGMSYWAISDLNAGELREFARLYREPL